MFTGLIEETGSIIGIQPLSRGGLAITIGADLVLAGTKPGDSLAINGVCQTVTGTESRSFTVEAVGATLSKTTLGSLRCGSVVNLERACTPSSRLGGHVVQGHISGRGFFEGSHRSGGAQVLSFALPDSLMLACCPEGSICIDGVSLTIASLDNGSIHVSVIPHTLNHTTLGTLVPGQAVNVEPDLMARYALHFFRHNKEFKGSVPETGPLWTTRSLPQHDLAVSLQDWGLA